MNVFVPSMVISGLAAGYGAAKLEQKDDSPPGWVLPTTSIVGGGALIGGGLLGGLFHAESHYFSGAPLGAASGIVTGAGVGLLLGGMVGAYLGARST